FELLRGHVQICYYTWLALSGFAIVEGLAALRDPARRTWAMPRALGIFVAAAQALGLAGFYNLPLADYAHQSIRGAREGGGVGVALDHAYPRLVIAHRSLPGEPYPP